MVDTERSGDMYSRESVFFERNLYAEGEVWNYHLFGENDGKPHVIKAFELYGIDGVNCVLSGIKAPKQGRNYCEDIGVVRVLIPQKGKGALILSEVYDGLTPLDVSGADQLKGLYYKSKFDDSRVILETLITNYTHSEEYGEWAKQALRMVGAFSEIPTGIDHIATAHVENTLRNILREHASSLNAFRWGKLRKHWKPNFGPELANGIFAYTAQYIPTSLLRKGDVLRSTEQLSASFGDANSRICVASLRSLADVYTAIRPHIQGGPRVRVYAADVNHTIDHTLATCGVSVESLSAEKQLEYYRSKIYGGGYLAFTSSHVRFTGAQEDQLSGHPSGFPVVSSGTDGSYRLSRTHQGYGPWQFSRAERLVYTDPQVLATQWMQEDREDDGLLLSLKWV